MRLSIFLCVLALSGAAPAGVADDVFGDEWQDSEYTGKRQWQEQSVTVPGLPEESNLIRLDVDYARFRYSIDETSISIGKEDRVARYTVVIESPAGARNIMYEGMRCDANQYKTYAYAAAGGPWHRPSRQEWRPVETSGALGYRGELAQYYLCNGRSVRRSVQEIIKQIRYPSDAYDGERVSE